MSKSKTTKSKSKTTNTKSWVTVSTGVQLTPFGTYRTRRGVDGVTYSKNFTSKRKAIEYYKSFGK